MTAQLEQIHHLFIEDKPKESVRFLEEIYEYEPIEKKKKEKIKPINYYLN